MKQIIKKGSTSKNLLIKIPDSNATDGSGKTGIVYNSASLVAYYIREGAASAVSISLVDCTVGTFTAGGLKEVANMPGVYQFCPPDAALASGAESVVVQLRGASGMGNVEIEIQLVDLPLSGTVAELGSLPGTAPTLGEMIQFLFQRYRFPRLQTASAETMKKADGSTSLAAQALTDDGTTLTRGAFS